MADSNRDSVLRYIQNRIQYVKSGITMFLNDLDIFRREILFFRKKKNTPIISRIDRTVVRTNSANTADFILQQKQKPVFCVYFATKTEIYISKLFIVLKYVFEL